MILNRIFDFYIICEIASYIPEEFCFKCANFLFECQCWSTILWNCPYDDFYDLKIDVYLRTDYVWCYLHCSGCRKELSITPVDSILCDPRYCDNCISL